MWATALGIAENVDVNVQLSKSANESAPVDSQRSGSFALIPIDLLENDKDKLLSKFFQRFGIEDARPVHPQHQCFKLRLRRIRVFSAHVEPGGALHRHERLPLQISYTCWGRLVNYVRMVQIELFRSTKWTGAR